MRCRRRQWPHSIVCTSAGLGTACIHSWDASLHHNIVPRTCGAQTQSGLCCRAHFRKRNPEETNVFLRFKYRCSAGMHEIGPLVSVGTSPDEPAGNTSAHHQSQVHTLVECLFFPLNYASLGIFSAQLRPFPAASALMGLIQTDRTCEELLRH